MRRRLTAFLLAIATFTVPVTASHPAVADDKPGIIGSTVQTICDFSPVGAYDFLAESHHCEQVGDHVDHVVSEEWNDFWDSALGELLKAGTEFVRGLMKFVLTVALQGPSLRLEDTGLFGEKATLAGILVWLGLVISVVGLMWQVGRMAVTGQVRHLGQAVSGWFQNCLLCAVGVSAVAMVLEAGDALTDGLVKLSFGDFGAASGHIVDVLVPHVVNPFIVLCGLVVLVPVGFIQLVLIFLRNSAIPIQCLLLPIAGAGRVGGDASRKWAPLLIKSILLGIAYKPMVAVIVCAGFAEFGHADTTVEWLRGLTTLMLGVIAPAALMRIFGPIAEEVGSAMSSGGATAAMSAAASYASRPRGGEDHGDGAGPSTAVEHARRVEQSMSAGSGGDGQSGAGGDVLAQAARNQSQAGMIPSPTVSPDGMSGEAGASAAAGGGGAAVATGAAGAAGAAAGGVGIAIQVLDGLNSAVQRGAGEIGNSGGEL